MRKFFPGYYRPNSSELNELWNNCIFIFDTNVLLDLHRYSKHTCNEFLSLLEKISNRIWIPHQVGLEYQENRLAVIAEQERRYDKATKVLDETLTALDEGLAQLNLKKSHSPIDPRPTIDEVRVVLEEFKSKLEQLSKEQPKISDDDTVRNRLDVIFEGKVGPAPSSQQELDKIYEDGKVRQERKLPPGFNDQDKGKTGQQNAEKKESYFVTIQV